jgi:hypothetical protein
MQGPSWSHPQWTESAILRQQTENQGLEPALLDVYHHAGGRPMEHGTTRLAASVNQGVAKS